MSKPKPSTHTTTEALLDERQTTHGDFTDNARFAQLVKDIMHTDPNWNRLQPIHKESLDYIVMKMSRVLAGDPTFDDVWQDISGYALLPLKFNHGRE